MKVRLPGSTEMKEDGVDNESLSHTKWNCKYHVVFAPKYRRKIIYGKLKDTAGFMRQVAVEQYIRNQLEEDRVGEQLEMKELFDPFTGEPAKKDK